MPVLYQNVLNNYMKNFKLLSILFVIIFGILNCQNQDELSQIVLQKNMAFELLSDSSYMGYIHCIGFQNNKWILSDYTTHRLIILSSNFKVKKILGGYGSGPGELKGATYFTPILDSIYIIDSFNKRINVYDLQTGYIRQFSPNLTIKSFRFASDSEGNLYLSTNYEEKPITKIDRKGKVILQFGNWFIDNGKLNKHRNSRHINIIDSIVVSVGVMHPNIELYDLKGNYLFDYDLSQLKSFESILRYQKYIYDQHHDSNISYIIIYDTYMVKNKLYILYSTYNFTEDQMSTNNIIEFTVSKENIVPQKQIIMENKDELARYKCIAVHSDTLVAFNRINGELNIFPIYE